VGDIDKTRPWDCSIVKGSCSKHQVWSLSSKDPTLCQYHQLIDKGAYVVVTSFKDVDGNEWIEGGA